MFFYLATAGLTTARTSLKPHCGCCRAFVAGAKALADMIEAADDG